MVIRLNSSYDLEKEFKAFDRDYYSASGYDALLDYFDSIDENMELDVIAICSDWTEYGPETDGDYDVLIQDYGYFYPFEEWAENNNIDTDIDLADEETIRDYITDLCSVLENHTEVIELMNDDYLIMVF